MDLGEDWVQRLARLSRLELEPGEAKRLAAELASVLVLVERLGSAEAVETSPDVCSPMALRADLPREGLANEDVVRRARAAVEGFVAVPSVIPRQVKR